MRIAINQPYFSPYAGYYALIHSVDIFVIFDCVQFPRRGRVHRSQIHDDQNFSAGWLTLPIKKHSQNTIINNIEMLRWSDDFYCDRNALLLDVLEQDMSCKFYKQQSKPLVEFLWDHHMCALKRCGIDTKIMRSSEMGIADHLKGQDRILDICERLKADAYINLPGGKDLYHCDAFKEKEIDLQFINTDKVSRSGYLQAIASGCFERFLDECHIAALDL